MYGYDDNGNTLSKNIDGTVTSYQYNLTNRLVQADSTQAAGGMLAQFYYNVDGIRTRKVVDGTAINYLVDANQPYAQVIAETNDVGQAIKTYLYGDDLISQSSGGQTHRFHYDGLGSTRLLSDDSGNVSDQYRYAAFGELLNSTGDTDNAYLVTGEQYDDSVDNYYLRARYYNPEIGRFTRQDEWMGRDGEPVTLNKYLYTHADPVNGIDPSGYMNLVSLNVGQNIQGVLVQTAHRQFFKSAFQDMGCELGFALAEQSITYGIYVLFDGSSYYVGQSNDIDRRHNEHVDEALKKGKNLWKANSTVVARFFTSGGKDALRVMEQYVIDAIRETGEDLKNQRNAISKKRGRLRNQLKNFKKQVCK